MGMLADVLSDGVVQTLVGGLVAAVAGLIALSIGRRNENDKWLRNERLTAYIDVSAHVSELHLLRVSSFKERARSDAAQARVERALSSGDEKERQAALNELTVSNAAFDNLNPRLLECEKRTHRIFSSLKLLGPSRVEEAAYAVLDASEGGDESVLKKRRGEMFTAMQRTVRPRRWKDRVLRRY